MRSSVSTNLVLITVHSGQSTDMGEDVLNGICKLERIDVAESELHMGVNNQLGQPQDLATEMEGIAETRLLPLLGG